MNKSYYAIIPASVRYDKDLTPNAKLLYGELTALSNEKGYCWASNAYFSELYGVSKKTVSNWITSLDEKGFIKSEMIYKENSKEIKERRLYIAPMENNFATYGKNLPHPMENNFYTPIEKKVKDNNTSFNNTFNNTVNKRDIVEQSPTTPIPYAEIIDYLNQKTGKHFKATSEENQRYIRARFKKKFTVDDFKKVIDIKTAQWMNDKKMSRYLRPSTLFGSKFESYLNEEIGGNKNEVTIRTDANGVKRDRLGLEIL